MLKGECYVQCAIPQAQRIHIIASKEHVVHCICFFYYSDSVVFYFYFHFIRYISLYIFIFHKVPHTVVVLITDITQNITASGSHMDDFSCALHLFLLIPGCTLLRGTHSMMHLYRIAAQKHS
jgi:hypothetical protein